MNRVVLSSGEMVAGRVTRRRIKLSGNKIEIEALTSTGSMLKKFNEDAAVVVENGNLLVACVVDGGTAIATVETLDQKGISGGKYVADALLDYFPEVDMVQNVDKILGELNQKLIEDVSKNHPSITYGKDTYNAPYGSVAAVKIDAQRGLCEVANAGDVFVVLVDKNSNANLVSIDDIREHDLVTFSVAKRVAVERGVVIRDIMEHPKDEIFKNVFEQMRRHYVEIMNTGKEKRLLGGNARSFSVAHFENISLEKISSILIFSDGAIPVGADVREKEGLKKFVEIVKREGLEGLFREVKEAADRDPNFEKYPRFRNVDDFTILEIFLNK